MKSRDSRIKAEKASEEWESAEYDIIDGRYAADQHDGEKWEVQGVPPASTLKYIYAFFELGRF